MTTRVFEMRPSGFGGVARLLLGALVVLVLFAIFSPSW